MAKTYTVRINCEYVIEVEADNDQEAILKADKISLDSDEWTEAWSTYEVEEEEEDD